MSNNIIEIEKLVKLISKLPGLGPKSAKRITLKLINNREDLIKPLSRTLAEVYKNVVRCMECGNFKSKDRECDCNQKKFDNIKYIWRIFQDYRHIKLIS